MSLPGADSTRTPAGAFLAENVFARFAMHAADHAERADEGSPSERYWQAQALTRATLAVAYEQRQTRFDLLGIARGEL